MLNNRIIVWGEMLVDVFPDKTVTGGAPFNVAQHLHSLGQNVVMVSAIGLDPNGILLSDIMQQRGMDTHGVSIKHRKPTGQVRVSLDEQGNHQFSILENQAWDDIERETLQIHDLRTTSLVYYGSLAQRGQHNLDALLGILNRTQARRFFDLNWREGHVSAATCKALFEAADVVKLSEEELNLLLGWYGLPTLQDDELPMASGWRSDTLARLLNFQRPKQLLCTYGARGSAMVDAHGVCLAYAPASPITEIVDTVGAGDAFSSCAIDRLTRGYSPAQVLNDANGFASQICQIRGAVPSTHTTQALYENWRLLGHVPKA